MYGWIWRHLPGNAPVRALTSLVLALGVVYLLFQFVFPWAEPLLPFGDATVNGGGGGGSSNVRPVPPSGDGAGSTASPGTGASHGTSSLNGAGAPDPRLSPGSIPARVIHGVLPA
ncbi:hypothetical protein [Phaeacidiphilus oryzae]|uniref:hypothetical protein n=1 Tax=Phaeacidiphilus oryzae TaxID=348818 RepID=UPI000690A0AC|nr:hypothetical protein [Phaeacidiphilus oryzae]